MTLILNGVPNLKLIKHMWIDWIVEYRSITHCTWKWNNNFPKTDNWFRCENLSHRIALLIIFETNGDSIVFTIASKFVIDTRKTSNIQKKRPKNRKKPNNFLNRFFFCTHGWLNKCAPQILIVCIFSKNIICLWMFTEYTISLYKQLKHWI